MASTASTPSTGRPVVDDDDRTQVQGRVCFTVLRGAVGAVEDGEPISLGGPQQRRLLAALLADHDSVVSADRLLESIWPDGSAPEGARKTVMTYVSRLRAAIGSDHLVTRDNGYELVLAGASYDAAEFELGLAEARAAEPADAVAAYDRALAHWSGRAYGEDAEELWLQPVAARLEELRLVAQEERAERLLASGRHTDAVADLESLVVEQPLRERYVELLMRALYLSGRQAEALRAFQRYRDYLADETGLVPSDGLADLERRVTLGDPTLTPETGVAVPGYELGEVIGEGSFGSVYRAVQPSVGREVAVKVVRSELADDPRFVQRFEAEAQLVARLEHPHVVPLYDYWRRPGGAFLVFRLLRGGSLSDRIAEGPLPPVDVTRLVGELSGALATAHGLGVVHRDVKPANVLFDETGNSYLADFGIAVVDDDLDVELRSAGSPLYAAPEQARDGGAGPAADQYALAVVAWEALAGSAPYTGSSATAVLEAKAKAAVPPVAKALGLPAALDDVLRRATAPHPSDRYPSVGDFAVAWDGALATADPDVVRTTGGLDVGPASRTTASTVARLPAIGANPYKGLRAFREADRAEFHGRDELIARLVEAVEADPFVAVVGPSGSGKSSLVHAGLVPELRDRGALVVSMVPGTAPMEELEAALRRVATTAEEAAIHARLQTPGGLVAVAADLVGPGDHLVLVVDQFEELWTLAEGEDAREPFATLLAHAASGPGTLRVVVTLRADLYDRPLEHPELGPVVSGRTFGVTPMTTSELQAAIVEPAERVGIRFEAGLVGRMVGDVISRPGALPLLQFTLSELYERRSGATVAAEAYAELGGIGGALARRAEEIYEATDPAEWDDVHQLFTLLVTPDEDGDDLRRRATVAELAEVAPSVIETYRANRLLVTDHHPVTREPTVEVAHEALLREWPRLAGWLDADRDAIRVRRSLAQAAREWREDPADESALYRGTRLAAADDVAHHLTLAGPEREFLAASHNLAGREHAAAAARAAAQVRQNRRLRRLLVAAGVVLVVALVATAFAVSQRGRAEDQADQAEAAAAAATHARLRGDAERLAPTDRDLAMLLAVEAYRRQPGAAGANALATALFADPSFLRYVGDPAGPTTPGATRCSPRPSNPPSPCSIPVHAADNGARPGFSPDSSALAIPDPEAGEIRIVDVLTGREERTLDQSIGGYVRRIDWLPSGVLLVSSNDDLVGVDAENGEVRIPRIPVGGRITSSAVSRDGRRVAVLVNDGERAAMVMVLELPSGRVLLRRRAPCCVTHLRVGPSRVDLIVSGSVAWRNDELYVGSATATVEAWDPLTGQLLRRLSGGFPAAMSLALSEEGDRLYVSGTDETGVTELMAYDAETGLPLWATPQPVAGEVAVDPRHDAVIVADTYHGGPARRYDGATGQPTGAFDLQAGTHCDVSVSPDGRYLVTGICQNAVTGLWSLAGEGAARRLVLDGEHLVTGANPAGTYAALGDPGGPVELDVATGQTTPIELPAAFSSAISWGPDGRVTLITPGRRQASSVDEVVRPSQPFAIGRLGVPLPAYPLVAAYGDDVGVTLDATGRLRVFTAMEDGVPVEDADGWLVYPGPGIASSVVLSPGGDRAYVAGTNGVFVYDLLHHDRIVDHPFSGFWLALDAEHERLAVSALEGTVAMYDAETLAPLGPPLTGPPGNRVVFVDDSTLVAADSEQRLQVYDVHVWVSIGEPIDTGGTWWVLSGRRSVLAQPDGALVEITLDPGAWIDQACLAAGRNLSLEEWDAYVGGPPRATCPQWPAPA